MPFTVRDWVDGELVTAAKMEDMETRLSSYSDTVGVTGTTYYVSSSGSDAANGRSKSTPWQTTAKVNGFTFAPGDTILFKRGDTFRGSIDSMINIYYNNLTYGAYGVGVDPILSGGDVVTGFSVFSGTTYSTTRAVPYGTPGIVTFKTGANTVLLTRGSGSGALTTNQYFHASSTLYVNLGGINPSSGTIEIASRSIFWSSGNVGITIQDLHLTHFVDGGIALVTSGSGHLVQRCQFRFATMTSYAGCIAFRNNGAGSGRATANVFHQLATESVYIGNSQNVEVDHNYIDAIGGMVDDFATDGIQVEQNVANDNSDGFWIHDNYINMGPVTVKGGIQLHVDTSLSGTSATGIVERNTIIGGNYGVGLYASGITVRKNIIHGQSGTNQAGIWMDPGGARTNCVIIYNLIYGCDLGLSLGTGALSQQLTIAHNTIADCTRQHVWLDSPIYGFIENNILWNTGAAPTTRVMTIASIVGGQTLIIDYNLYYTAFTNYLRLGATDYSTLASWRTGTGQDAHSISSDPLFAAPTVRDYRILSATSPVIDAGTIVPGIEQFFHGSAPVIGLLETT